MTKKNMNDAFCMFFILLFFPVSPIWHSGQHFYFIFILMLGFYFVFRQPDHLFESRFFYVQ